MKTNIILYSAALLAVLLPLSCVDRNELKPSAPQTLEIRASIPGFDIETKSADGSELPENLYAYPLGAEFSEGVTPLRQNSSDGSTYLFNIPGETRRILFSTIGDGTSAYGVTYPAPASVFRADVLDGQPIGTDVLTGWLNEYTSGQASAGVTLTRASARVMVELITVLGQDTLPDYSTRFSDVSVSISDIYTSVEVSADTAGTVYSGSGQITLPVNTPVHTLPAHSDNPPITLTVTTAGGETMTYSGVLPARINRNGSYSITLTLTQDNVGVGFTLEDITVSEQKLYLDGPYGFSLITLSNNTVLFGNQAGEADTVTVTKSLLGTWTASIPAEALGYFSFENLTNGTSATAESPVLTGEEGDEIRIATLQSNSTTAINEEILFSTSDGHTYPLTLYQSNGMQQSITYYAEDYHYLGVSGINLQLMSIDNSGNTETLTTGNIHSNYNSGRYQIVGDFITYLNIGDADLSELSFSNCVTLSELYLTNCIGSLTSLNLDQTPVVESLEIDYENSNTQGNTLTHLGLSGLSSLKMVILTIPSLQYIDFPTDKQRLEEVYIYEPENLEYMTISEYPSLNTFHLSTGTPAPMLKYIELSGCTALSSFQYPSSMPSLYKLDLTNCSSLKDLDINRDYENLVDLMFTGCSSLESFRLCSSILEDNLDFTGCTSLKDVEVALGSITNYLIGINLSNCGEIDNVRILAPNLTDFTFDGTQINNLELSGFDVISSVNFASANIKNLNVHTCNILTDIILTGNTNLRKFETSNNYRLANIDLSGSSVDSVIVEGCTNLTSLNTSNCAGMTHLTIDMPAMPTAITDFPRLDGSTNLHSIYLERLPIQSLDLTAQTMLDSLDISYCSNLKDLNCSGLTNLKHFNLVEGGSDVNLSGCTSLKELDLEGDYLSTLQTDGMTGLEFLRIENAGTFSSLSIPVMPNLQEIQLNNLSTLSSFSIAEGNAVKRLKLYEVPNLNPYNLAINSTSSMEQLQIYNMAAYTESGYTLDFSGYTALKLVNVQACQYLKDVSFNGCSSISKLYAKFCYNLTDINIDGCSSLTELDLCSTDIDTDMAIYVLEALPDNSALPTASFYSISWTPAAENQEALQEYKNAAQTEKKWYSSESGFDDMVFDFRD